MRDLHFDLKTFVASLPGSRNPLATTIVIRSLSSASLHLQLSLFPESKGKPGFIDVFAACPSLDASSASE
jgi:hypothetical protein